MRRLFGTLLAASLILSAAPNASAEEVTLTGPGGHVFDIDVRGTVVPPASGNGGTGGVDNGTSDATDRFPFLCVCDGCLLPAECDPSDVYASGDVDYTLELADRGIVLPPVVIQGLNVHREIYVPETGAVDFVRYFDVLENPTAADVTVNVRLGTTVAGTHNNDLGSDSGTNVTATSDGDTTIEPDDYWFCTDDSSDGGGDPSLGHVVQGVDRVVTLHSGAIDSLAVGDNSDVSWEFVDVTVPAGEQIAFVSFFIQADDRAAAAAAAALFEDILSWPAEAMEGIDPADMAIIVNFIGDSDGDGYTVGDGDCDDRNADVYPGAAEVCDGFDNDCNGEIDELSARSTFYADADGDGFGDAGAPILACVAPPDHVADDSDCDDACPTCYPGAPELCDELDNDCDDVIDNDLVFVSFFVSSQPLVATPAEGVMTAA